MSKQREAMKMALNVIDNINTQYALPGDLIAIGKAKSMLREALAESERKPLTDREIEKCMKEAYATVQGRQLEHAFARAIERAHGIGN